MGNVTTLHISAGQGMDNYLYPRYLGIKGHTCLFANWRIRLIIKSIMIMVITYNSFVFTQYNLHTRYFSRVPSYCVKCKQLYLGRLKHGYKRNSFLLTNNCPSNKSINSSSRQSGRLRKNINLVTEQRERRCLTVLAVYCNWWLVEVRSLHSVAPSISLGRRY